ncbi:MAG: bifunctional nuclease family protein [Bacteroidales bacterium]|nr:bifunctional nuclease family protein [Bacteroidales bacterium]MDD4604178.1 bifunctional nuclease family protein [Bacteroidales bacterium]
MDKIRLDIIGMSYSQSQSGAYALILGERDGKRRLPIIIGGFEAQSIAIELEKIKTPRPLTHDLFKAFAEAYHIVITEVVINKFSEGIFYAKLVCSDEKTKTEIDSRTSDAIALALRFNCPIYTFENIMSNAGIMMDEDNDLTKPEEKVEDPAASPESFSDIPISDLKNMLREAVENEEYEKASKIRDELNKRK